MRAALLSLCLLLTACLPTRFEPVATASASATAAPARTFVSLERGAYSGVTDAQTLVVRERAVWAALLERVSVGRAPHVTPPAVDFGPEMVLGVFLGTRRTGGYAVEIVALELSADTLVVRWRETAPAPGAILTQALTAPYHLVKTTAHAGPVRFERE
jgi:hypothetical protein